MKALILLEPTCPGLGFGFTPALSAIASYYRRRRAMVNGIFSSGAAIGGLVLPIALSKIIDSPRGGVAWALRASGFISFFMLGIAFLVMKQRKLPPSPKRPILDFAHFRARNYTVGRWMLRRRRYLMNYHLTAGLAFPPTPYLTDAHGSRLFYHVRAICERGSLSRLSRNGKAD